MTSKVIEALQASSDELERDLASALIAWQEAKRARGEPGYLGREPTSINEKGAVATIESRVRQASSGFTEVALAQTYEAIVVRYPEQFDPDVVETAQQRLQLWELGEPTADRQAFAVRVDMLAARDLVTAPPSGQAKPETRSAMQERHVRDPKVAAWVWRQANGVCELCEGAAPFSTKAGPYLEVHHVRALAADGSDRVENAVALCPNCHRAVHLAEHAEQLTESLYARIGRLVRE